MPKTKKRIWVGGLVGIAGLLVGGGVAAMEGHAGHESQSAHGMQHDAHAGHEAPAAGDHSAHAIHDAWDTTRHVHGVGRLTRVMDGQTLLVSLRAPAVDLLGFEREPATPAEWQQVEQVARALRDPAQILKVQGGAGCPLKAAVVEMPVTQAPAALRLQQGEHRDVRVNWRFDCTSPEAAQKLQVSLGSGQFPSLHRLVLDDGRPLRF